MKKIKLTLGKYALVDDEDFEKINKLKWHANKGNTGKFYPATAVQGPPKTKITMHRFIMKAPKGMEVDHINGDSLDNRKINLRLCTKSENQRNVPKRKTNTSGYKGVWWNKTSKKWAATIKVDKNKLTYLGSYITKEEAYKAYCEACVRYHGKFANTN